MDDSSASRLTDVFRNMGASYYHVLTWLHAYLNPRVYLEIGAHTGASFRLASCPSLAIDPGLAPFDMAALTNKPAALLFQMTSDQFFRDRDPAQLLGGRIDFAFLDGMHLFEWVLRDFLYVERFCRRTSVIALHDCLPPDRHFIRRDADDMTLREGSPYPDGWGGDVWKIVPTLRRHRPDLRVHCFNADPTGLVLVTNLDPTSTLLSDRYFDLIAEAAAMELPQSSILGLAASNNVLDTGEIASHMGMARFFWPAV